MRNLGFQSIKILLIAAAIISGSHIGWATTIQAKAIITINASGEDLASIRRQMHTIAISNNYFFADSTQEFPSGTASIATKIQRADQLEAILLGTMENSNIMGNLAIAIYCELPCTDWKPFAEVLNAEISAHWPTEIEYRE